MTPFQEYAQSRWVVDFPQWVNLREDLDDAGEPFDVNKSTWLSVRYSIPSPANQNNILWVVFTPHDILVKFAVYGSHEHYDPDLYGSRDLKEDKSSYWAEAYEDAINEYIRPVIEDRMFAVYYNDSSILVADVAEFLKLNHIESCHYESWSWPIRAFRLM